MPDGSASDPNLEALCLDLMKAVVNANRARRMLL